MENCSAVCGRGRGGVGEDTGMLSLVSESYFPLQILPCPPPLALKPCKMRPALLNSVFEALHQVPDHLPSSLSWVPWNQLSLFHALGVRLLLAHLMFAFCVICTCFSLHLHTCLTRLLLISKPTSYVCHLLSGVLLMNTKIGTSVSPNGRDTPLSASFSFLG